MSLAINTRVTPIHRHVFVILNVEVSFMKLLKSTKVAIASMAFASIAMAGQTPAKQDVAKQAPVEQAPLKQEGAKQEAAKQEAMKQEAAKQEAVRQESAKQEAAKQEAVRQESAKQEAAKQEEVRQEAAKQEAAKQEAVRQEAAKQEAAKQEVAKQEAAKQEAVKQEAKPVAKEERVQKPGEQTPSNPERGQISANESDRLSGFFSVLHHFNQLNQQVGEMAQSHSESEPVRAYALNMVKEHAQSDAKLLLAAEKFSIAIRDIDPNSEMGQTLTSRETAQMELLKSLKGNAWDQEFLTRIINCQSNTIRLLEKHSKNATSPEMKSFFGDLIVVVTSNREVAQKLLEEIGGR